MPGCGSLMQSTTSKRWAVLQGFAKRSTDRGRARSSVGFDTPGVDISAHAVRAAHDNPSALDGRPSGPADAAEHTSAYTDRMTGIAEQTAWNEMKFLKAPGLGR